MEVSIYPEDTVTEVVQRSVKLVSLIPGLQKEKISGTLNLATPQGEVLEHSHVVHPISIVVLHEAS